MNWLLLSIVGLLREGKKEYDLHEEKQSQDQSAITFYAQYTGLSGPNGFIRGKTYKLLFLFGEKDKILFRSSDQSAYIEGYSLNEFRKMWLIILDNPQTIAFSKDFSIPSITREELKERS